MKRKILKFGGSVLNDVENIERVISVIRQYKNPYIIVVSAINGITDRLENILTDLQEENIDPFIGHLRKQHRNILTYFISDKAELENIQRKLDARLFCLEKLLQGSIFIDEIPDFVKDKVICFGEKLSSLVITSVLNANGISCKEALPEEIGLITDGEFGNAVADLEISGKYISKWIKKDINYVIPGFYGISKEQKVTVFGRGGSDYTAGILANCLNADGVDLWKDVCGFLSADPTVIGQTLPIKQLTYLEAAELAYFGAGILHPNTVDPLIPKNIPINLFNISTYEDIYTPDTHISEAGVVSSRVIKSITSTDDVAILRLIGGDVGKKPGIIAQISGRLSEENINIRSIITSQTSINFLFSINNFKKAFRIIEAEKLLSIEETDTRTGISLIAVVGNGINTRGGIFSRIFKVIAENNINIEIICQGASDTAAYFIVKQEDKVKAIQAIHEELFAIVPAV